MLWLVPAGLALGTVALLSRRASARPTNNSGDVIDIDHRIPDRNDLEAGTVDVRALAAQAGAPSVWQDFFAMTAYGESRAHSLVGLGVVDGAPPFIHLNSSTAEAKAACAVYRKNPWLEPCWPSSVYCFGSGGLFAMLPGAALAAFRDVPALKCAHPWSIFDSQASMIYAAWFARRLQGWSNWTGSVLSLRTGWGNPSAMDHPSAAGRKKFAGHCEAVGLPASFLDQQLPRWKPAPAADLWVTMGVDPGWLPEEKAA